MFDNFVALPVLGGPAAVESGPATYLAGTAPRTLELIEPVLGSLGGTVRHYGMARLASSAKLTVNLLLLSGVASLAESFAVGRSGGLDNDQLNEGRDLVLTTDFRQVLGEVVSQTLGSANMEVVFPGAGISPNRFLRLV